MTLRLQPWSKCEEWKRLKSRNQKGQGGRSSFSDYSLLSGCSTVEISKCFLYLMSCCGSLSGFYAAERECAVKVSLIYSFALAEFSRLESALNHLLRRAQVDKV